ncbi:hypothetical protein I316_06868 [Kwoniella heveanensis BCC8398]|uniref:Uncharacterized protein n=1 Tax=Kwoniella heveanensis BCC8398 TaxID=1296120 RepID=A0A1B9GKC8_9TREE|nr:hypothetical protein I316_06868 [Kwoniella heveanensis BCC8398]
MPLLSARARYLLASLNLNSKSIPAVPNSTSKLVFSTSLAFAIPLRLFGSFASASTQQSEAAPGQAQAQCTRYLVRRPSEMASRESPFPVVFVRAKGLGLEEEGEWKDWSAMFSERGYTAVEIDIVPAPSSSIPPSPSSPPPPPPTTPSSADDAATSDTPAPAAAQPQPFKPMTTTLATQIRLLSIPFPPIIIARGAGSALLAQAFVEDHPASGLVLINPPPDEDPRRPAPYSTAAAAATATKNASLTRAATAGSNQSDNANVNTTWTWPKFGYEPHFPLLIMSSQAGLQRLSTTHRLVREGGNDVSGQRGRGKGLEVGVLDGNEDELGELSERGRMDVERWMDRCGF